MNCGVVSVRVSEMDIITTMEKQNNPVQPKEQDNQVEFVLIGAGNKYNHWIKGVMTLVKIAYRTRKWLSKRHYRTGMWLSKLLTGREFGSQNCLLDGNLALKINYRTGIWRSKALPDGNLALKITYRTRIWP